MKGKRVKLIRSNIATNLGAIGTVNMIRLDGTLEVDWDSEIHVAFVDDDGKDCYKPCALSWVAVERVEVLIG